MKMNILLLAIVFALFASGNAFSQERFVATTDGVKLFVKTVGKGEPCLFVHGGPGQGSLSFEQMRGNELEKHLSMIYLDQRGSGKSGSSADYSLDRMIEDIEEVRKELGYKKLNLLAHSFGGVIAVNYAKKYPKRVSRLIMANATLYFYSPETLRQQIRFIGELLKKEFPVDDKMSWDDLKKILAAARQELNQTEIGYKVLTENVETIQKMNGIDGYPTRNKEFGRLVMSEPAKYAEYYANYTPLTSTIKIPVLVLSGTTDRAVGIDHYRTFRFPKQTVKIIPGGHMPYYDSTETFVQAIYVFIKGK